MIIFSPERSVAGVVLQNPPALRELKTAGVKLAVPLVSQGELIGVLNLGPRLSEQDPVRTKLLQQAALGGRVRVLIMPGQTPDSGT